MKTNNIKYTGVSRLKEKIEEVIKSVGKAIKGKRNVVELILTCLIGEGHILIEDIPGVGKTTMVKAISKSLGLSFNRVQFTPDVLPTDITGLNIYNQATREFRFIKGPVFTNILLADEINRATPKTQSSLLEVMEEKQVTVDGTLYRVPYPFMVLATQNPIEFEGTYTLPESQMDRFMMKISMGYPQRSEEREIIEEYMVRDPLDEIEPVLSSEDLENMIIESKTVYMSDEVEEYILDIVDGTRKNDFISLGVSPRGALQLAKASRAYAYIKGRDYVIPDDVKKMSLYVLPHRVLTKTVKFDRIGAKGVIEEILRNVKVPRGEVHV